MFFVYIVQAGGILYLKQILNGIYKKKRKSPCVHLFSVRHLIHYLFTLSFYFLSKSFITVHHSIISSCFFDNLSLSKLFVPIKLDRVQHRWRDEPGIASQSPRPRIARVEHKKDGPSRRLFRSAH